MNRKSETLITFLKPLLGRMLMSIAPTNTRRERRSEGTQAGTQEQPEQHIDV